jgi:hypothetical protein
MQCVLAPIAPLRALGGNALALRALGMAAMPSFAATNPNLAPFELRDPRPPTSDEQTEAMLNPLRGKVLQTQHSGAGGRFTSSTALAETFWFAQC